MTLFERITSFEQLKEAFAHVEENGGTCGTDNVTIEEFSCNPEQRINQLRTELLSGTYRPHPLLRISIPKDNGKLRQLAIPAVRDRVAQTSATAVLTPILDKEFEDCSFAYRKERSVKKAVQRIAELRDRGYVWVVDGDITSFFDEVDHNILMEDVTKYVHDRHVFDLISLWLEADIIDRGHMKRLRKGIPQGSPISPLLSNLYLDEFDESLLKAKQKVVRFADDFVILCKDRPSSEEALEITGDVLERLHLCLNEDKTRITNFDHGFHYLGTAFLRSMIYTPVKEGKPVKERRAKIMSHHNKTDTESKASGVKSEASAVETIMKEALTKALDQTDIASLPNVAVDVHEDEAEIVPTVGSDPFFRTLYIIDQGAVLGKEDERFKVTKDKEAIKEIPVIKVDQVLIFGNIQVTTQAMKFCLENDIPIMLLSMNGRYFGTVDSFKNVAVTTHKKQFDLIDQEDFCMGIARSIIRAKINNAKVVAQRYARKRPHLNIERDIEGMNTILEKVPQAQNRDELLGFEGAASVRYFSALRLMLGEEWAFKTRQKQPPTDPINSLLSFGYTLLFHNIWALVRLHSLHPYAGFLHAIRDGHPALISDILEEFRAPVVDAMVMNMTLRKILTKDDFLMPENDGSPCLLKNEARKIFIRNFEGKMNSAITHGPTGYNVDYRRCIDLQVQSLKKVVEGTAGVYEGFEIK
jgi:CRISP-associated protein Cas1